MDATLPPQPTAVPPSLPQTSSLHPVLAFVLTIGRGLKSWLLAAFSCLSIASAVLFSGWTYRLVQRRAQRLWTRRLNQSPPNQRTLPRWFFSEEWRNHREKIREGSQKRRFLRVFAILFGSLGANLRTGFLTCLNSLLITLPGGMIMMFSWYSGWDNSFNKGYEQAANGPIWGFVGIFLFMAAMTYLPIAQARQAITGSAKAFWNYRKVRQIIGRRPIACLLVTAGYAFTGAIFMVAVSSLMFIGNQDRFQEMLPSEIISYLNSFYFWWAFLFIAPCFVLLKLAAGRIYASATYSAVTEGAWPKEDLIGTEQKAFEKAPVTHSPPPLPNLMNRGLAAFSRLGRCILGVLTFLLLLGFSFQLYVGQFLNFEPSANWLRQPMVQLPWFHKIPEPLQKAASEE